MAKKFVVVKERLSKRVTGEFKSKTRARNKADKLDNLYGSCKHRVKEV